jgi:putative thymidine phosphorylase
MTDQNQINQSKSKELALSAIKKKLLGKTLSYEEIYAVMNEIGSERLGPVLTTYFAAAGFRDGFSEEELFFLAKAMVETGPKLHFDGIVAGKHSMGGVAGTRTTMIVVPIIAALAYKIPKTSTRAITSPAGTADTMEVFAPVTFSPDQIQGLVEKIGACIVWGGYLGLAPADDVIIQIEQPLAFESYDKVIVSIMAKQIASGVNRLVLDIPYGKTMKIEEKKDAEEIARKFLMLAGRFGIKAYPYVNEMVQNAGYGAGPALEARDVLAILEQAPDRSMALEEKALKLSGFLLDLCVEQGTGNVQQSGENLAREVLKSGKALEKFKEIIKSQGGNPEISRNKIAIGDKIYEYKSDSSGIIRAIHNQQVSTICRILGCPMDKKAGIVLNHKLNEHVDKDDILCTLYATDDWKLKEAIETLKNMSIYTIVC